MPGDDSPDPSRRPDPDQAPVVSALSAPAAYANVLDTDENTSVDHVETHISHVFLVGDHVFKLKKNVAYNFVDFSTRDKRRRACEAELRLNARTAPDMYLGILPVTGGTGDFVIDGPAQPVDWVVHMARFDDRDQFDKMARDGRLTPGHMRRLADRIAAFHADAAPAYPDDGASEMAHVVGDLKQNLTKHAASTGLAERAENWGAAIDAPLAAVAGQLAVRARHGRVKHCHGDLHLQNICLFKNQPTLFDAIEFNEDIARTDVYYDLAFLLMDVIHRDRPLDANRVLSRYAEARRDYTGLRTLRVFISVRAAIRAMVSLLPGAAQIARAQAAEYLDLALETLTPQPAPRIIAVGGVSGTGKSTCAEHLFDKLGLPVDSVVLRSDSLRKRMHGAQPEDTLPKSAYSRAASDNVYARMMRNAAQALSAGASVVLDAVFLNPEDRMAVTAMARRHQVPLTALWLDAPVAELERRVAARAASASDASDAGIDVLHKQLGWLAEKPAAHGWRTIDASGSPEQTLAHARHALTP